MPNVCSAIGSNKFETVAGVRLARREGPHAGSNALFEFEFKDDAGGGLEDSTLIGDFDHEDVLILKPGMRIPANMPDLNDAVCLISCVKSKRGTAAPARDLYVSRWFRDARDLVEAHGGQWYVLSALYGLVLPGDLIQPYDHTLNNQGTRERMAWAKRVLNGLLPRLQGHSRVIFFAGQRYREYLVGPPRVAGYEVCVPMEGLRQGEQRAWLSQHR